MPERYVIEVWYPQFGWYPWDRKRSFFLSRVRLRKYLRGGYPVRLRDLRTGMIWKPTE